jgi:hypothetical protein
MIGNYVLEYGFNHQADVVNENRSLKGDTKGTLRRLYLIEIRCLQTILCTSIYIYTHRYDYTEIKQITITQNHAN